MRRGPAIRRHRVALAAIAVSTALHLIVLLTFRVSTDFEKGLRFRLAPRLVERRFEPPVAAPQEQAPPAMERRAAPGFRIPQLAPTEAPVGSELPAPVVDGRLRSAPGADREAWVHPGDVTLDLNQLALELAARRPQADRLDDYMRPYAGDADTSDAESRSHRRARLVVLRAIEAMGGLEALTELNELHVGVWLETTTHDMGTFVGQVPPYYYPVARWHFTMREGLRTQTVPVKLSLDPAFPNLPYQIYNPGPDLQPYNSLFTNHWDGVVHAGRGRHNHTEGALPNDGLKKRAEGVRSRWHFLDRFLSHDVRLGYVGPRRFEGISGHAFHAVETIVVDDHRYGQFFLASFSRDPGLLIAVSEGFTEGERRWHFDRYEPPWLGEQSITEYEDFRPVGGVLLPHRIRRSRKGSVVELQLHMSVDQDSLVLTPPEL